MNVGIHVLIGLFATIGALILAFMMTGAGHGTYAPFIVSPCIFLIVPLARYSWKNQKQRWSKQISLIAIALSILSDVSLVFLVHNDPYFTHSYNYDLPFVIISILWLAIFLSGQICKGRTKNQPVAGVKTSQWLSVE